MEIAIVAAVSLNGVIGHRGRMPWKPIKEDMARMHSLIDGNTIIVGRRTMNDVPQHWDCEYLTVSPTLAARGLGEYSFKEALNKSFQYWPTNNIYALGGTRIFEEAFRFATKLYLTKINREYYGDTYFPTIPSYWTLTSSERVSELLTFEEYANVYQGGCPVPIEVT
jgi:dihydrofolate reductase